MEVAAGKRRDPRLSDRRRPVDLNSLSAPFAGGCVMPLAQIGWPTARKCATS
jgi:hypothetical protein